MLSLASSSPAPLLFFTLLGLAEYAHLIFGAGFSVIQRAHRIHSFALAIFSAGSAATFRRFLPPYAYHIAPSILSLGRPANHSTRFGEPLARPFTLKL
jgi:hypothetical protein